MKLYNVVQFYEQYGCTLSFINKIYNKCDSFPILKLLIANVRQAKQMYFLFKYFKKFKEIGVISNKKKRYSNKLFMIYRYFIYFMTLMIYIKLKRNKIYLKFCKK